jgi:hypothetical protein
MKIDDDDDDDDDDDEMQKINEFLIFLFNIFFKRRVIESADGDPANKTGLLYY